MVPLYLSYTSRRPSKGLRRASNMDPKTGNNFLPKQQQPTEIGRKSAPQFAKGTIHFQFLPNKTGDRVGNKAKPDHLLEGIL